MGASTGALPTLGSGSAVGAFAAGANFTGAFAGAALASAGTALASTGAALASADTVLAGLALSSTFTAPSVTGFWRLTKSATNSL